jgi:hypothetical protein
MKKFLKASSLVVFAFASLTSSTLSAWYDPSGYWGRHYSQCYQLPSRGKYTIRAELLLLRPHVDNLKVNRTAIENAKIFKCIPNPNFIFSNDERKRRFKWRYGWKVGIGFACYDCWEADLNWTSYSSKAFLADFNAVESKWKLQLEMIDLEIGKEMWFRRCFRLKPYIGIRSALIRQRWRFNVEGAVQTTPIPGTPFISTCLTPVPTSPFQLRGNLRHIYLALGPRIGFDASWCVGCGFSFFFTAAANYLYGEMQNRYGDSFVLEGIDKDHHWEGTGITDLSAGIGWSDLWWNERRRLTFRFGYENHFFIHENKLDSEGGVIRPKHTNWFIQGVGGTIAVDF